MSKETTLEVLRRAVDGDGFRAQLSDDAAWTLESFDLTSEEKGTF